MRDHASLPLRHGSQSVDPIAKVDTSAAYSIFDRGYAEMPGLNVESDRFQIFQTVTGSFPAYEYQVTLQMPGIEFFRTRLLRPGPWIRANFLGRTGWLDRLRIAIVDYDRTLYHMPTPAEAGATENTRLLKKVENRSLTVAARNRH